LKNMGNTCFMNAALQIVAASFVLGMRNSTFPKGTMLADLVELYKCKPENSAPILSRFYHKVKESPNFKSFDFGQMEDCMDFLVHLIESFKEDDQLYSRFELRVRYDDAGQQCFKCQVVQFAECDNVSQNHLVPNIIVSDDRTLHGVIIEELKTLVCCPNCRSRRENTIVKLPSSLILRMHKEKIRLNIEMNLQFPDAVYELVGIAYSTGYHAYAFSKINQRWYKFDDHQVEEIARPNLHNCFVLGLVYQQTEQIRKELTLNVDTIFSLGVIPQEEYIVFD